MVPHLFRLLMYHNILDVFGFPFICAGVQSFHADGIVILFCLKDGGVGTHSAGLTQVDRKAFAFITTRRVFNRRSQFKQHSRVIIRNKNVSDFTCRRTAQATTGRSIKVNMMYSFCISAPLVYDYSIDANGLV